MITVGMFAKIRQMYSREKFSIRDIERRTTVRAQGYSGGYGCVCGCEYAWIGGLRQRLEVTHCRLAASPVFWLVAYPSQSHEMLLDAHSR